ncbi:hypothetical protein F5887DRAFT_1075024 [Amanita rubescens]|nr:hypothetical protein F5887DRAFT_1075024 [Amanita rubescens]
MTTRRSGRSLRPPLNRDEAMLPLIQRRERQGSEDARGSYEPGMIAAGYVEGNNVSSDSEGDGGPPTDIAMETQSGHTEDGLRADGQSIPIPDVIDLTGNEPMNGNEGDINEHGEMNGSGLYSVDLDVDENHEAILEEDYVAAKPPELSNEVFQILLDTLNSGGIVYTSPKGKGREVTAETVPSTSSDDPMGENADSETDPASTLEVMAPDPPLSSEHLMTEGGGSEIDPALLVSVHRPGLGHGHVVFRAKKTQETWGYRPLTPLYFYQLLRSSSNVQLEKVNILVDRMSRGLIRLATSRAPVFMNQKDLYNHPLTGFRQLGYWEQLDTQDTLIARKLDPVLDTNEKRSLLIINGLDETLNMYVLYIWTDMSEEEDTPSSLVARDTQNAVASWSAASQDNDLIPEEYQRYLRTLVLGAQNSGTAFSMFMYVRIVTEICKGLGIPCITGVRITERYLVGDRYLCVSDVIEKLGHRKPGTFANYRGIVNLTRLCLEHLETWDGDKGSENKFIELANELLRTPLDAANGLNPRRYGMMKYFNENVKRIAQQCKIKGKQADTMDESE